MHLLDDTILSEQIQTELFAVDEGVRRYWRLAQRAIDRGEGAALKPAQRLLAYWFPAMVAAVDEEKKQVSERRPGRGRAYYGPPLLALESDALAVITIHTMLSMCMIEPSGVRTTKMDYSIGRAVLAEINLSLIREQAKKERRANREARAADPHARLELDVARRLDRRFKKLDPRKVNWFAKRTLNDPVWSIKVCIQLGACLRWLLTSVADADPDSEEFQLSFRRRDRYVVEKQAKRLAFVVMAPKVLQIIDEGHSQRQYLRPRYDPMVVRPFPWSDSTEGGYTRIRTPFVSKPIREQKRALHDADLSVVYECLNAINATPWRINKRVLGVVEALIESGGGMVGIPKMTDYPLPPRVETDDADLIKRNKADRAATWDRNVALKSEREGFWQKMQVARRFADKERFYEPHQFDFRGRTYPIPPHLHHQGDDVCRGILEFAEPRSLDDDAWRSVKIQAANSFGFDKASFDDRVRWTEDHLVRIHACADDPLDETWWMEADEPFQFLRACIALSDPQEAERLPVQRDGACNGLQHYAALSRDAQGAALVNMVPGDKPADVYRVVCEAAAKIVRSDGDYGASLLDRVVRDVVKQPVMTSVYGVTMVGARKQVMAKLKKMGMADHELYRASSYLSKIILQAIGETCVGAGQVMKWLRQCAAKVCGEAEMLVAWKSPIGFPVVQPYKSMRSFRVRTVLQNALVYAEGPEGAPPMRRRQIDGLPPNYVHSIDATHWLTTALACRDAGVEIAGVHDSFWTHAATASVLDRILREQFVELHGNNLLADMHAQLEQLSGLTLPPPPEMGSYRVEDVLDSQYFFH